MARPVPWEHWSARDARRHQTSAERRWENRSGSGRVRDELLRRSAARWPDREAALRVDGDEWETHMRIDRSVAAAIVVASHCLVAGRSSSHAQNAMVACVRPDMTDLLPDVYHRIDGP